MSGSEVYVHQVVADVGRGSIRYVAVVVNSDGHPRAWCGHAHRSREMAEKCGGWAAGQHARHDAADVAAAVAVEPDGYHEDPIDQARRISAEDLGWEMDGEEPDDVL